MEYRIPPLPNKVKNARTIFLHAQKILEIVGQLIKLIVGKTVGVAMDQPCGTITVKI